METGATAGMETGATGGMETGATGGMVDLDATLGAEQDPRVERSRRVILQAVLDELGRVGYSGLSIEAVAARAGVGKSTIYRHWQGKAELVEDAFNTLKAPVVAPETGTLRERLIAIVEQVACLVQESTYSACIPALIDASERDPRMRAFHQSFSGARRAVLVGVLRDAVGAGELPASTDPELLADALVGPIILRRVMLNQPIDPGIATELVDLLLPVTGG